MTGLMIGRGARRWGGQQAATRERKRLNITAHNYVWQASKGIEREKLRFSFEDEDWYTVKVYGARSKVLYSIS